MTVKEAEVLSMGLSSLLIVVNKVFGLFEPVWIM